jgi:2-amino-4-hydroxy-6-hydroxymethyldihydropteridine diphosphokinase
MPDAAPLLYVVGLGANLGDRLATLRSAVLALGAHGTVTRVSSVYATAAVGPPQPDYLNAAVLLASDLPPSALLAQLLDIERRHGRERRERWGPRSLDLDLLLSPGLSVAEPGLTVPHPELRRRAFALVPLLDVLPDAVDERSGSAYADVVLALGRSSVQLFLSSESWDPRPDAAQAPGRTE